MGMGESILDYPNVPEMFEISSRILGYDLLEVCLDGDISRLNQIDVAQAAVAVTSLGAVEKLRYEKPNAIKQCIAATGMGVGEITALIFAGSLSFEDGVRLIKIRGESMLRSAELVPSGQVLVLYGADARINFACRAASEWCIRHDIDSEYAICSISQYLFPHCKVIGGHKIALEFLEQSASDFGIKKIKRLAAPGAFNTRLMAPAKEVMKRTVDKMNFNLPLIAVHSNFDTKWYGSINGIREKLVKSMTQPIKMEQIFHTIYEREPHVPCPYTFECGPGHSMLSLLEKVNGRGSRQGISIKA